MEYTPFFTILTAAYNSAATIRASLESVREQTFTDVEHIVTDGASSDDTAAILKEFESTYNLKWVSEPDAGVADALNKGLNRAQGKYILVIQADDQLLNHDVLQSVYSLIQDERFDIYSFPVIVDHPARGRYYYRPFRYTWWHHFKTIFPHQGTFVHRRVYDQVGGYRKEFSIGIDYDFFYRALKNRCPVCIEQMPVAVMGGTGVSSNRNFLEKRIREEARIQKANEDNPFWRFAQLMFRALYFPYKTRIISVL